MQQGGIAEWHSRVTQQVGIEVAQQGGRGNAAIAGFAETAAFVGGLEWPHLRRAGMVALEGGLE